MLALGLNALIASIPPRLFSMVTNLFLFFLNHAPMSVISGGNNSSFSEITENGTWPLCSLRMNSKTKFAVDLSEWAVSELAVLWSDVEEHSLPWDKELAAFEGPNQSSKKISSTCESKSLVKRSSTAVSAPCQSSPEKSIKFSSKSWLAVISGMKFSWHRPLGSCDFSLCMGK